MSEEIKTHYRTCPICEATCGLEIQTQGDQVIGVKGDKEDVFSKGFVCTKGLAVGELHHDPDRLKTPMIREGAGFRKATWEEAFELIEKRIGEVIETHGRDSLGIYLGNPNVHNMSLFFYTGAVIRALKSTHIYSASSVDQLPKQISGGMMFGTISSMPVPDVDRTDYFMILGANPMVSGGSLMTAPDMPGRLKAIKARGGKVVVLDPRRTLTAKQATEHHFIYPGTDAFFLFALVNVLFEENLVDPGEIKAHLTDIEPLRELAKDFTPEAVADRCRIPADTIRTLARELAAAKSAAVYGRMGTTTQEYGVLNSWLIDVVNTLTGNLDRPGGVMFSLPAGGSANTLPRKNKERGIRPGKRVSRVRGLPQFFSEFPAATMADEILEPGKGQMRALFTIAGNPAVSLPGSEKLEKAFADLDLMVSFDLYMTETNKHADVILPGISPLEDDHFDYIFAGLMVRDTANYSEAIFPKPENQLSEWEILLRLFGILTGRGAKASLTELDEIVYRGWSGSMPLPDGKEPEVGGKPGPERILDHTLRAGPYGEGRPENLSLKALIDAPHGVDLGALKPRIPEVLRTATGKVEMTPEIIVADVQRLRDGLKRETPSFALIGRRHIKSNNSWMRNLERLVKGDGRRSVFLHPEDAKTLGLEEGDQTKIASASGSVEAPVKISDEVMPGVICLPHGWSPTPVPEQQVTAKYPGANINILSDPGALDVLSGNAVLNGVPVTLTPLGKPAGVGINHRAR